jgi:hypothetical protein
LGDITARSFKWRISFKIGASGEADAVIGTKTMGRWPAGSLQVIGARLGSSLSWWPGRRLCESRGLRVSRSRAVQICHTSADKPRLARADRISAQTASRVSSLLLLLQISQRPRAREVRPGTQRTSPNGASVTGLRKCHRLGVPVLMLGLPVEPKSIYGHKACCLTPAIVTRL